MRDVEDFAREHDLEHITYHLKKGALVAQLPNKIDNIGMLLEEDRQHLRFEKQHKWRHPLQLYITIIVFSIGAAVQGWYIHRDTKFHSAILTNFEGPDRIKRRKPVLPRRIRHRRRRHRR